ncbi:MAG: sodium:proton antiporter, partial [Bacteroidia bacterium]|nr:sodium:proton antiporter [Bacteroidia bacterium]
MLLLIAYIFDISSKFTKIPSVILLIALGVFLKFITLKIGVKSPEILPKILPILGSIGLILIVLEGALELEISKGKNGLILNSFLSALLPMIALGIGLAWLFYILTDEPFIKFIINALPLSVISSAIAIPSVRNMAPEHREFVVFESSFSDILGVMFFNFFVLNRIIDGSALLNFSWDVILMILMAFVATVILSLLLNNIKHHVRFVPIILLVILTYEITKVVHLPGLIFVLIFGLFLGNIEQFSHIKWMQKLNPIKLKKEVDKFEELIVEFAFLIRTSFFMLFGFLLKP